MIRNIISLLIITSSLSAEYISDHLTFEEVVFDIESAKIYNNYVIYKSDNQSEWYISKGKNDPYWKTESGVFFKENIIEKDNGARLRAWPKSKIAMSKVGIFYLEGDIINFIPYSRIKKCEIVPEATGGWGYGHRLSVYLN